MELELVLKRGDREIIKVFSVPSSSHMTLLDALWYIKENADPTISFRSMCRAGVCGTCGVKANGKPVLACSVDISSFGGRVRVEPLDGLRVIRDLVVDHEALVERLRRNRVWMVPTSENKPLPPSLFRRLERGYECIMCGLCDSVCPVLIQNNSFGGPMAFAKAYPILLDPRNKDPRWQALALKENLINACTHCKNCSLACPKSVMPEALISLEENYLVSLGLLEKNRQEDFGFL
ncbi:succinate dehydrogenase and fumarate reductase iron-sulfur protein [Thermocrinis albus DSM 14484]|uniref:Fumarate reductase iron-sulfur subunit n=1 Tax=Thermocrinis albus (strain DSM 14484 / JCM 11386 / HI 11/12) TaxID=638303 RepID=D3SMQ1_THEAH|nr:2Fe-2S iron-sulfur cluster-binding protein [Thermocrinis albus]ADC90031.1 succinate dehydrogenase and fumarate reductase iron-sulfur protein [Thermocrinis albus DSM 14484]